MPSEDEALHFGPRSGPPIEMTKAQILLTIGKMKHIELLNDRIKMTGFFSRYVVLLISQKDYENSLSVIDSTSV